MDLLEHLSNHHYQKSNPNLYPSESLPLLPSIIWPLAGNVGFFGVFLIPALYEIRNTLEAGPK